MTEQEKKAKIDTLFQETVAKIEKIKAKILAGKENKASADDKEKIDQILGKIKNEL
jgi:hypothetical protein